MYNFAKDATMYADGTELHNIFSKIDKYCGATIEL